MRSNGGGVSAFSRVRKPWPKVYAEAVQIPKVTANPREAWDSSIAGGGKKISD